MSLQATKPSSPGKAIALTPAGVGISGLTKVFGDKTVVDSMELRIEPGELVSLLGPSGCGKTTTLRMLAGFTTCDAGTITIDGKPVTDLPPEKRPTAMVFQNYALWPHMTVFRNIAYPLRIRRQPKAEIEERVGAMLELVNLTHHRNSRPATISGGEQQRVALARALVQEPKVLLLDEPLSNLDAKLRIRVREDIRELQQRLHITTVLVTHDQDEALSVSDRIAVMNGGRIEQVSTPEDLYSNPRTEFVASFVGSLNQIPGDWRDGVLSHAEKTTTAIRPEDVLLGDGGNVTGTVTRVVPRGHFAEVVVAIGDVSLHSFTGSGRLAEGDRTTVRIRRRMLFRDGVRVADD